MKLKSIIIISFLPVALFFASCGANDKTVPVVTEEAVQENENPDEATLTAEQIKTIGIELGVVEQKQLTASLKTNGVLKVPNQNKASINSLYGGIIRSLLVQPGTAVRRGQTIATISNPDFIQVQGDYLAVASRIVMAEQEYNRQKELNAGNAGALKNLQAADAELKALRTRRSSLQQQIQLMGINPGSISNGRLVSVLAVRTPINGVVSNVNVKMGSYVDLSTVVAEVVDNSSLHLDLFVYEKDLPKLKNKQTIHFTVTNNPGKEYDAEIFSLGSSFENESKAVSVHAMVKGDKTGLIDGMSITAAISLEKATVSAVPTEAIVTIAGQDYIFIQTDEHTAISDSVKHTEKDQHKETDITFKKIPIAKGTSDIGFTEISLLKTVPENAKVVVKGAFFILATMTNSGEHEH